MSRAENVPVAEEMTSVIRRAYFSGLGRVETSHKAATMAWVALAILLTVALAYWTWYGTTQRSLAGDNIISLLAIQGIVEHGYPQLPSGYLYHRGYFTNYLTAGSILALGNTDLAIVLPMVLLALGSLLLTYLLARDVMGRPWVGVAAVALLILLQVQTFYATAPRMYMGLQFFTLLASYSAWRGYVKGETKYQWITVLAIFAAFFEQQQSGVLLAVIPVAVLVVWWMKGQNAPKVNYAIALGQLIFLGSVFLYLNWYGLPGGSPTIAAGGSGVAQEGLLLNLDPGLWFTHLRVLEYTVPFGLMLAPLMAVVGFRAFQQRHEERSQGFLYVLLIFTIGVVATMVIVNSARDRFWLIILPAYALLLSFAVAAAIDWLRRDGSSKPWRATRGAWAWVALSLAVGIIPLVVVASAVRGPAAYGELVASAYGFPCSEGSCSRTDVESYTALQSALGSEILVISSNPFRTYHYLGRVDGWLRERPTETGTFTSFDSLTDEYFGVPLIDSLDKLRALRDSERPVWILATPGVEFHSSPETLEMLEAEFTTIHADEYLIVYTNTPDVVRGLRAIDQ